MDLAPRYPDVLHHPCVRPAAPPRTYELCGDPSFRAAYAPPSASAQPLRLCFLRTRDTTYTYNELRSIKGIKRATAFHYELNDDERTWRGLIEVISYLHPDASGHAHRLQALNISLATFSEHSAHLRWLLHPQKSSYPPRITPCHAPMSTPYHTATPRHMPHALLQADSTQSSTSDAASGFTMHRCTLLASPAPMARMFAAAVRSAAPARAIVFATMQAELRLMAPSGSARAVYHYKPRLRF
ncbi:hypothetical protein GGX14DRAFT_556484 [Mycena pura]|uniref:Uncharacterized protein n=1 Tax=Mycena pura TaxID=153505 RepID=A0AAD6YPX3_9AGAR|nr:hypothetical protein GGX14DRAFT_556484 [Mycena pura]